MDMFEPGFLDAVMAAADDAPSDGVAGGNKVPADLPDWFMERHEHAYKYEKNKNVKSNDRPGRPTPATVVFSWQQSAHHEPISFGSYDDTASMCRARPSPMTQYINFDIDVREGQSHGMNDANARVKDKLLFDPGTATRMEFKVVNTLPDDILGLLGRANADVNSQTHTYAIIEYTVGKERPIREFAQRQPFTPGSAQAAFYAEKPHYYTVVYKLATALQQKDMAGLPRALQRHSLLVCRWLPTGDWYYSYDGDYSEGYTRYISDADTTLPNLP
ncbi:hypothetical protein MBLNU13_g06563t2 [Cladosporium sp. NU13]